LEATDFSSKDVAEIISPQMIRPNPNADPKKEVTKERQVGQKGKVVQQLFQVDSTYDSDPDTDLVMNDNEDYDTDFARCD